MVKLHVLTSIAGAKLWIFRDRTPQASSESAHDAEDLGPEAHGFRLFQDQLDHQIHEVAHALLHDDGWKAKEKHEHIRTLPRSPGHFFPSDLWLVEGVARVLESDPMASARSQVRVHLMLAGRYAGGKLYIWTPGGVAHTHDQTGVDADGPYFDVTLAGRDASFFCFKFQDAQGGFEPDSANRLWVASDGGEIWVFSDLSEISGSRPVPRSVQVLLFDFGAPVVPELHLWRDATGLADLSGTRRADGWVEFTLPLFTGPTYGFKFRHRQELPEWEHDEAARNLFLDAAGDAWTTDGDNADRKLGPRVFTLEGDHELFAEQPVPNRRVELLLSACEPSSPLTLATATRLHVWINRARWPLGADVTPDAHGVFAFDTYEEIVTSFRFASGESEERLGRHYLKVKATDPRPLRRFIVLERPDPLPRPADPNLFRDPPFPIERPGIWIVGSSVRFAVHAPSAASVEVVGEWTGWESAPIQLACTRDGTYFWGEWPVTQVTTTLGRPTIHDTLYKLRLNQVRLVQDPAADWVESSDPSKASKLVDHDDYVWQSSEWRRPSWDYLIVYQLHPSRFAQRDGSGGLDGVTRELRAASGYLKTTSATALLLMPTCEFAGNVGWGYNPSFFFSVESAYGGPNALKRLVDTCHQQGIAVLLDVVFNHAGTSDNVLWSVARESFFDGDTEWGAMINFDHPQVRHFFECNLVHFLQKYRVDGFRFDFTRVIREGGTRTAFVRVPGSGGGWEFMHGLRRAAHAVDPHCLFMAENLPNDWDLTRFGGPMDTQWCDDFHDRLVDAARGSAVLGRLADAMRYSEWYGNQWYETTNYPESHDEVGNVPDRIARVAGPGQGYRRNKVAAAATLFSRGVPMWFMGAEAGEWEQFSKDGSTTLDLDRYESDPSAQQLRNWWRDLCRLRRGNDRIQGPSPLRIQFADDQLLALTRGDGSDYFVVLNFGGWSGWRSLAELNLPDADYKELLNSTWGSYRVPVEGEDEHQNGGWQAHLTRGSWLNVPDYGVVVLERRA
jgi:1,4-alpha-glucan branching enzyme